VCQCTSGYFLCLYIFLFPLAAVIVLADALTIFCTIWLVFLWFSHRTLFLKPSISLLSLSLATLLWPHMLMRETVREYTAFGDETFLYLVAFVLGGLLISNSLAYLDGSMRRSNLNFQSKPGDPSGLKMAESVHTYGLILIVLVTVIYLIHVPPTQTGLYAIFFDPENSGTAREHSLKLLDAVFLKYLYLITYSLVAPLVFVIGLNLYFFRKPAHWFLLIAEGILVCLFLMLTGARAGLAYLAIVWLALVIIRRGLTFKIVEVVLALGFFLAFPAILSQMREGGGDGGLFTYVGLILDRVFLLPTIISAWFLEFANTYGFGGWDAVLGRGGQGNLYNEVALEYTERYEPIRDNAITAPSAYFIQNLYTFGWLGLIPSWAGLILMDWPAARIRNLVAPLKAPFYAMAVFYPLFFLQSGYGVVWVTNGYLFFAMLIIFLANVKAWYRKFVEVWVEKIKPN